MASSQQLSVLEAVVQLDRTLTHLLGHVDLLRDVPIPVVIESITRFATAAVAAMRDVREQLVARSDDVLIESVERALHTRARVVMMGLDELHATEHEVADISFVNTGRFRSVAELSRALTERIGRINASLARKRRDLRGIAVDDRGSRALYHVALDNAEFGYAVLGKDPDVAAILHVGASTRSKRFRIACRTLAWALDCPSVEDLTAIRGEPLPGSEPTPCT